MTLNQLSEELHVFKTAVNAKLEADSEMLDKIIIPKLDAIIEKVDRTNGRVTKSENDINLIKSNCQGIQELKAKSTSTLRWYVVTAIMFLGLVIGIIKISPAKPEPIRVIYVPVTDSIAKIKPIRLRNEVGSIIDSFSIEYMNQ